MRTNVLKLQSSYDYFKPMNVRRTYDDGTVSSEFTLVSERVSYYSTKKTVEMFEFAHYTKHFFSLSVNLTNHECNALDQHLLLNNVEME